MRDSLIQSIKQHEGCRLMPYQDIHGIETLFWGHNCQVPFSPKAADIQLKEDVSYVELQLIKRLPFFSVLSESLQDFLIELGFWIGINGLMGFQKMLKAIKQGDFKTAKAEFYNSHLGQEPRFKQRMTDMAQAFEQNED